MVGIPSQPPNEQEEGDGTARERRRFPVKVR